MKTTVMAMGMIATAAAFALPTAPYAVQNCAGYNSWPMMQAIGRRLVCTYSRGTGHSIGEGVRGVYSRASDDCGLTWRPEVCIVDESDRGEVTVGKGLDSSGAMLLWVRSIKGGNYRHDLYRSRDGEAWTKLATPSLSPAPIQITDVFTVPGKGLMALWFAGDYNADGGHSWGVVTSTDDGRTWTQRTVAADLATADWPTEQSVVFVGDGKLFGIGRTELGNGQRQFQLQSSDSGETWTCQLTNISDTWSSTPSLIYDAQTGLVNHYYFQRGKGLVKRRANTLASVWDHPTAWTEPEVIGIGSTSTWDTGNANATLVGRTHFIAYYSGLAPNTAIYALPVRAAGTTE